MIYLSIIFFSFAFVHSITASNMFKHACKDLFGDTFMRAYYRALYNALSFITAAIAFSLIAQAPDSELWTAPGWLRWPLHGIQIAAVVFGALSFENLDAGEFLGIKQVWRHVTRRETRGNIEGLTRKELVTTGIYGLVRNPLYLAGIIIFTVNPQITVNSLSITALADLYFLFGIIIEERRFVKIFGDEYRTYRSRVPRLIPRIIRRRGS